jgi:hypothetical protein
VSIDYEAFRAKRYAAGADTADTSEPPKTETRHETTMAAANTADRRPGGGKSEIATRLETITEKAVGKLGEIIDLPLDQADQHFPSILRAQNAAANTALATQVKVDETALRRQQLDRLPALLKLADEVAKTLPARVVLIDGGENEP